MRAAGATQYNSALFPGRDIRRLVTGPEMRYAGRALAMNEKSGVDARRLPKRGSINDDITGTGDRCLSYMRRRFGSFQTQLVEIVPSAARIALECIGNSDALYHNVEHTLLVTLAGHDILRGRALHTTVTADDYAHAIIACLTHDIGYVRGLFGDDDADGYVIDAKGGKVSLPRGASDASLMPHHVDRSKLYVMNRIEGLPPLNKQRIADAIEGTRFPSAAGHECGEEAGIVRAADLIGQLGDPNYLRKANALYHEFEEVGINRQLGYESPADIVDRYPQFYFNSVAPQD